MHVFAQKPNQPQKETSFNINRSKQVAFPESHQMHFIPNKKTRFAHDFSRIPVHPKSPINIQAKLTVNHPGDNYEQEADRIANQVTAMPAYTAIRVAPPHIQRFSGQSAGQIDTAPASVNRVLTSPGRPLEPVVRQDMEQRFGHDFSRVRIYSDGLAEQSARELNANAYTVGHNIVFGEGRFAPGTSEGRRLIAHELTHTIQQSAFMSSAIPQHWPITNTSSETSLGTIAPVHRDVLQRQPAPPNKTEKAEESGGELLFTIFVADERKRSDKLFARRQAQADAARIRKSGTLSSEDRQLVNAKLRFFEGDAWKAYIDEIKPALVEATKLDEQRREEKRNYEGMAAYYASERQATQDLLAATQAKFREEVYNMTPQQIYSNWNAGKEAFISVASSPGHRLNTQQLIQIWLRYWDDRWKAGKAKVMEIHRREAAIDRDAFNRKMFQFYEDNERDAFGPEYRNAADNVTTAEIMFRSSYDAISILNIAENLGKKLTLKQLNEAVIDHSRMMQFWRDIGEAIAFSSTGGPRTTALAEGQPPMEGAPPEPIRASTTETEPVPTTTSPKRPISVQPPKAGMKAQGEWEEYTVKGGTKPKGPEKRPPLPKEGVQAQGEREEYSAKGGTKAKKKTTPEFETREVAEQKELVSTKGKEYRQLPSQQPGRTPDIAVLEVRVDKSVRMVAANREDVRALSSSGGSNTHIALANAPEGFGPITAGVARYRLYIQNGAVTYVEPLGKAAQTPELVNAIERALQRNHLVSPNGTTINLSAGKANETLKKTVFPR